MLKPTQKEHLWLYPSDGLLIGRPVVRQHFCQYQSQNSTQLAKIKAPEILLR